MSERRFAQHAPFRLPLRSATFPRSVDEAARAIADPIQRLLQQQVELLDRSLLRARADFDAVFLIE